MKAKMIIVYAALLFLMASCSSSRITYSWKSEAVPAKNYNKIMVVGLLSDNDMDLREKMENHLVGDLETRGYQAISSLKEYGPKSFENMKEADALDKLHNSGVDAVITIVLLDKKRERYYVPGRVYYSPYTIYQRRFWGYYSTIYGRIYSPDYYQVSTKYFWESNFYDMDSKELLFSAQTESFDPESAASLANEYGQMIVNEMAKKGIIK
ncbi:MAG TPA: hypothetical protein VIL78_12300 [Hanamia sp.]